MKETPWMLTHSGRAVDLVSPTADMIDPHDIAHALSRICRWTGHTRFFYSVAEHCVRACELVAASTSIGDALPSEIARDFLRDIALATLLHDAHEAYTGDISAPLKRVLGNVVAAAEQRFDMAIAQRFGLTSHILRHVLVKRADMAMLATEARDLMPRAPREWLPPDARPLPTRIQPWTPSEAYDRYLGALRNLGAL